MVCYVRTSNSHEKKFSLVHEFMHPCSWVWQGVRERNTTASDMSCMMFNREKKKEQAASVYSKSKKKEEEETRWIIIINIIAA